MKQVIVYTGPSGNTAICAPTGEIPIEEVQKKDIPYGIESFIVDADQLPWSDNDFFDAWEQSNGVVTINIEKSKEIVKNRLRFDRTPLLQAQDIAFQRALENGESTAAIVAEKNRLRDITKLADDCTTLDQLRALRC